MAVHPKRSEWLTLIQELERTVEEARTMAARLGNTFYHTNDPSPDALWALNMEVSQRLLDTLWGVERLKASTAAWCDTATSDPQP